MSTWLSHLQALADQREAAGMTRRDGAAVSGLIDLSHNDYLGLRSHPSVREAARRAIETYGPGAASSRLVSGTWPVHGDLEAALAAFVGSEAALSFSTGYHANLSVITALADADTLIISDAHNHASIVDACRLARGTAQVVTHNDVDAVRDTLAACSHKRAVVVTESVFSVLGDGADIPALAALCAEHDALLIVDEAHGIGVVGDRGEGAVSATDSLGEHVVVTTSLSKSLAAQGGAMMGAALIREHLVNTARPYIFDTGLAPASAASSHAALGEITGELASRVRRAAAQLADAAGAPAPAGAVLSVPMPGPREALAAVAPARAAGLAIGCFRPPSTPDGISRLRFTATAALTDDELDRACAVLREVTA